MIHSWNKRQWALRQEKLLISCSDRWSELLQKHCSSSRVEQKTNTHINKLDRSNDVLSWIVTRRRHRCKEIQNVWRWWSLEVRINHPSIRQQPPMARCDRLRHLSISNKTGDNNATEIFFCAHLFGAAETSPSPHTVDRVNTNHVDLIKSRRLKQCNDKDRS